MELSNQIKKYRKILNLSQEELAQKVYVSRQTISNWENDKNYPDINSLLLLSELFGVSLDKLIKGDLTIMEEKVKEENVKSFKFYGQIYTFLLVVFVLSAVPLVYFLDYKGMVLLGVLFLITFFFSIKVERIKKENDVQTYKEIVAFCNGKKLDDISKKCEYVKRPYQNFLKIFISALIALVICIIMLFIIKCFYLLF